MEMEKQVIVNSFINGNRIKIKNYCVKRYSAREIRLMFMEHAGYSFEKSALIAEWIVDGTGYQEMCDA
jgi:hypothetical protein